MTQMFSQLFIQKHSHFTLMFVDICMSIDYHDHVFTYKTKSDLLVTCLKSNNALFHYNNDTFLQAGLQTIDEMCY